eukprot:1898615-Rhodomonas_salina.1
MVEATPALVYRTANSQYKHTNTLHRAKPLPVHVLAAPKKERKRKKNGTGPPRMERAFAGGRGGVARTGTQGSQEGGAPAMRPKEA